MTEPTPYAAAGAPAGGAPKTNTLAIIALIGGFVIPLVGIIVGFIALNQIKTTGEGGRGLAIGGIIVGFVVGTLILLVIAFSVILPFLIVGSYGGYGY